MKYTWYWNNLATKKEKKSSFVFEWFKGKKKNLNTLNNYKQQETILASLFASIPEFLGSRLQKMSNIKVALTLHGTCVMSIFSVNFSIVKFPMNFKADRSVLSSKTLGLIPDLYANYYQIWTTRSQVTPPRKEIRTPLKNCLFPKGNTYPVTGWFRFCKFKSSI